MPDADELRARYLDRIPCLAEAAAGLQTQIVELLQSTPHIDRVSFRAKSLDSFVAKATREPGPDHELLTDPFTQIEDQIAGRVLVYFRDDVDPVTAVLCDELGPVERRRKEPTNADEFGYESEHMIFVIPEHLKPQCWRRVDEMPPTFEMQVRTLFEHAWAEPQHDIGYKATAELSRAQRRQLAWAAASAWGADQVMNSLARELLPVAATNQP